MTRGSRPWWLLVAIAAGTILTGIIQMIWPAFILEMIEAVIAPTTQHFFRIIGMFMVLFGGALLQALLSLEPQPIVVFWAGVQKIGACLAVGLGVLQGLFGSNALAVSSFDLFSGFVILWYWRTIRRTTP